MKAGLIACLLLAANFLWFRMMRTVWRQGFPMSFLDPQRDLKSFRALIEDSVIRANRVRLSLSLAALYAFLIALAVSVAY